jgi:hypothetical protein
MSAIQVDTTRLPLLPHELRLPAIARLWPEFAERADKEGWPAARFLSALAELEIAERVRRRTERNLAEARLLPSKTLDNFDFSAVPMLSKARVMALAAGDTWLDKATNLLLFGPPVPARAMLLRPSAAHLSRTATVSCSPAPRTSCRSCSLRSAAYERPHQAKSPEHGLDQARRRPASTSPMTRAFADPNRSRLRSLG